MDAITSATLVMSASASSASAGPPTHPGARKGLVTLSGVALCVPYCVHAVVAAADGTKGDIAERQRVQDIIDLTFADAEAIFSPFCASSELTVRVNSPETASVQEWFTISKQLFDVFRLCDVLHSLSNGLFDPTVVSFGKAYIKAAAGYHGHVLPCDHPLLVSATQTTGWGRVFQIRERTVGDGSRGEEVIFEAWRNHADVSVDPSAVSKGRVVDILLERLVAADLFDVFVDWGGDIRCAGSHCDGRAWTCQVRNLTTPGSLSQALLDASLTCPSPFPSISSLAAVREATQPSSAIQMEAQGGLAEVASLQLDDGDAACTSGDYFQVDLISRYHHLVDPSRMRPLQQQTVGSVTLQVQGGSCAWCASGGPQEAAVDISFPPLLEKMSLEASHCRPALSRRFISAAAASHLRAMCLALPRLTTVLFVPFSSLPAAGDSSGCKYVSATLSSFVFCSASVGYLFLQKPSAIGDALQRLAKNAAGCPPMRLGVLGSITMSAQRAAEEFSRGKICDNPLEMTAFPFVISFSKVTLASPVTSFGDHILAVVRCEEPGEHTISSFLMRAQRKYVAVAPPPKFGLKPGQMIAPRCCCVATVSVVKSSPSADGSSSSASLVTFLGTVLYGVDVTSRRPLLLSAVARPGPATARLFPESDSSSSTSVIVRLHFLRDTSDAKSLIDWFADVHCVDHPTQFMYFQQPNVKILRAIEDSNGKGILHVPYVFPAAIQVGFVDCLLAADGSPLPSLASPVGLMLTLVPLSAESSATLDVSSCLCTTDNRV